MTVSMPVLGGLMLAIPVMVVVGDTPAGWVLTFIALVIGSLAWMYSPLPDNNGGAMSGDPGRYWGWPWSDKTNKGEPEDSA